MKRIFTSLFLAAQVGITYAETVFSSSLFDINNERVEVYIDRVEPSGFELTLIKNNDEYKEKFAEDGIEIKGVILSPQRELLEVLVFTPDYSEVYYSFDL